LIKDYFIFFPNAAGMLLGVYYTLSLIPLASTRQKQLMVRFAVLGIATVLVASMVSFIGFQGDDLLELRDLPLGITAVALQIVFFASPIGVIRTIIQVVYILMSQTRDSSLIYLPLAITTVINCSLWSIYGIVIMDYFIAGPNIASTLLGLVQIIFRGIYPASVVYEDGVTVFSGDIEDLEVNLHEDQEEIK
jgi:solute carrier family 50 protein (sugar transporter)